MTIVLSDNDICWFWQHFAAHNILICICILIRHPHFRNRIHLSSQEAQTCNLKKLEKSDDIKNDVRAPEKEWSSHLYESADDRMRQSKHICPADCDLLFFYTSNLVHKGEEFHPRTRRRVILYVKVGVILGRDLRTKSYAQASRESGG